MFGGIEKLPYIYLLLSGFRKLSTNPGHDIPRRAMPSQSPAEVATHTLFDPWSGLETVPECRQSTRKLDPILVRSGQRRSHPGSAAAVMLGSLHFGRGVSSCLLHPANHAIALH